MTKKTKPSKSLQKAIKAEKKLQKILKKEASSLEKEKVTPYDNGLISWDAPEYIKHKKGWLWYTIFTVLSLGGATLAYLYSSWTFSLVILAFAVTYMIYDLRHPRTIKVILSDFGIKFGKKIFQYSRIQAFWIIYNQPFAKTLNIRVHNEYLVDIEIQLVDQDPVEIHKFLSQKLPELEGKTESFFTVLTRLLKL